MVGGKVSCLDSKEEFDSISASLLLWTMLLLSFTMSSDDTSSAMGSEFIRLSVFDGSSG